MISCKYIKNDTEERQSIFFLINWMYVTKYYKYPTGRHVGFNNKIRNFVRNSFNCDKHLLGGCSCHKYEVLESRRIESSIEVKIEQHKISVRCQNMAASKN